jgi:hypothetical protein
LGGAPSDYTRVVNPSAARKSSPPVSPGLIKPTPASGGGAQAGGSAQPAGGAAAGGGQRDWLPIVIGLGVIALIAIGLVIAFVLLR